MTSRYRRPTTRSRRRSREIVIEPRVGGRWFTCHEDGTETDTGVDHRGEPPGLFVVTWQIGADWKFHTDLITSARWLRTRWARTARGSPNTVGLTRTAPTPPRCARRSRPRGGTATPPRYAGGRPDEVRRPYASADDVVHRAPPHAVARQGRLDAFHACGDLLMVGTFGDPQAHRARWRSSGPARPPGVRRAGDPFVANGVVASYEIRDWNEVLACARVAERPYLRDRGRAGAGMR